MKAESRYKVPTALISLLISVSILQAAPAQAQSSIGLSVTPALSEHVVKPGQETKLTITVSNITGSPLPVTLEFRPIVPIDQVVDESARARYDASAWLSADTPDLLLEAGESADVNITVNPPAAAGAGSQYALAVFRAINQNVGSGQSSARVTPEISAMLLLSVPGETHESANISALFPPRIQLSETRTIGLSLTNTGSVHLLPTTTIVIERLDGSEVKKLILPPKLVLPGTRSDLTQTWLAQKPGLYRVVLQTSFGTPIQSGEYFSDVIVVLPAVWIMVLIFLALQMLVVFGLPKLFKLARVRFRRSRRIRLGTDVTESPKRLPFKR